jgi:hypothetical protein
LLTKTRKLALSSSNGLTLIGSPDHLDEMSGARRPDDDDARSKRYCRESVTVRSFGKISASVKIGVYSSQPNGGHHRGKFTVERNSPRCAYLEIVRNGGPSPLAPGLVGDA